MHSCDGDRDQHSYSIIWAGTDGPGPSWNGVLCGGQSLGSPGVLVRGREGYWCSRGPDTEFPLLACCWLPVSDIWWLPDISILWFYLHKVQMTPYFTMIQKWHVYWFYFRWTDITNFSGTIHISIFSPRVNYQYPFYLSTSFLFYSLFSQKIVKKGDVPDELSI